MRVLLCLFISVCVVAHAREDKEDRWNRRRSRCITQPRLRDKWHLVGKNRHITLRIRSHQFVYRHGSKLIKYRCVESRGNTYLLKTPKYEGGKGDGVLCLGFSYIADHPRGEYAMIRFMGEGVGHDIMSPVLVPRRSKLSINSTCDLMGTHMDDMSWEDSYETDAIIKRASSGCKFPKHLQGRWNFTMYHAKSLEIWQKNSTLHLMNGSSVKFLCDKRDGKIFIFRSHNYVDANHDAIMCLEFTRLEEDPFYSFELSRHNSGIYLDGHLKPVSKSETVYIHVHCDWLGSPGTPEFLYQD